jgi:hypothetical protein
MSNKRAYLADNCVIDPYYATRHLIMLPIRMSKRIILSFYSINP